MANPFDLERTLANALRPIDTLAAGTLQLSSDQANRMLQLGMSNQRRAQQLQDKEDDRAYQSEQTVAARKFQIGMEMLREDRQDKRAKQNTKEYFDRLDATTKAHIKQQIIEDQGISPKDGEKDSEFIQRAATERHESYKSRAKAHVDRQSKIDQLSSDSSRLIGEAQKDLEVKVKDRASKSLASILKPDEAPLLNKLDPETVINQIASKEPDRAQSLRADYAMFTDQAQKALAGYVNRDLQTKLEQNQKQLRTLEYQQGLDMKSRSWDNIIPHVQDLSGKPEAGAATTPAKLTPNDGDLQGWMDEALKNGGNANGQWVNLPQQTITGSDAPAVPKAYQKYVDEGVFTNTGAIDVVPNGDAPTMSRGGLIPVPGAAQRAPLAMQMSDRIPITNGLSISRPALAGLSPDVEASMAPRLGQMSTPQIAPEIIQKAQDVRTAIYGGSVPSPEEEQAMRAAAIQDGMTEPQMVQLFHRAMKGDQAAINIARSYRQRVSKAMSGF